MRTKKCNKCGEIKEITEFPTRKNYNLTGTQYYHPYCYKCWSQVTLEHRQKRMAVSPEAAERARALMRAAYERWVLRNLEKHKELNRRSALAYYHRNKERLKVTRHLRYLKKKEDDSE